MRGWSVILVLAIWGPPALAAGAIKVDLKGPQDNQVCLGCHQDPSLKTTLASGKVIKLYVNQWDLEQSVHRARTCTECHQQITKIPHRGMLETVNCARCHYVGSVVRVAPLKQAREYMMSAHRAALERGDPQAPTCQDCHGGHHIRPASDPTSPVNRENVPATCGRCHLETYGQYRESIHGQALLQGNRDVPVCVDCHGEHSIRARTDPRSQVYPTRVAETCSRCHGREKLARKYGIPAARAETYRESYHGIASRFGETTVANCASCHGAHEILPSSAPRSAINLKNLPRTCGKCHQGANPNFARGKIHVIISPQGEKPIYWVSTGFKWLTILVMMGLVGHIMLDLLGKWRARRQGWKSEQ